jgi:hypothetical protein
MIDPSEPVAVIAHAISLIKCSKGSSVTGFLDAAAILRHSIHKNSIHYSSSFPSSLQHKNSTIQQQQQQQHPTNAADKATTVSSSSRYSYQMYAIVHTSCAEHATLLAQLGYTILVKDHPVKKEDIRGEWLRNHIESENCCGSAEFIKLYGKCRLNVKSDFGGILSPHHQSFTSSSLPRYLSISVNQSSHCSPLGYGRGSTTTLG